MTDADVLSMSAAEQAKLVRDGKVSARELVDLALDRIEAIDGELGAFLAVDADGARRAGDEADRRRQRGDRLGPLHGVPCCVKDLLDTEGIVTTYGSALYREHVPAHDAPAVARLRAAGAIVLGKTNTPEFGLAAETVTTFGPPGANPWDPTRTTGGSSGGTAAAIAAEMCSIGLGSDAGGSIRLPAAWCGVLGLKPTYGRVPVQAKPVPADHPTETVGPMARTVDDLALVMDIIAGSDPADPGSLSVGVPDHRRGVALDVPLTVRFGLDLGMGVIDETVAAAIHETVAALGHAGVAVLASDLDVGRPHPFMVMFELIAGSCSARYADDAARGWDELADYSRTFIDAGRALSAGDYVRAVYEAKVLRAKVDEELSGCDVLLLPATAVVAWPHGSPPTSVGGSPPAAHGGITFGGLPFLALANVTGHPALSVPCGIDPDGLPVGVQLIGRHFDEPTVLRAAARLLAARPFVSRPPIGSR